MFDEFENIYPPKPQLAVKSNKEKWQKHLLIIALFMGLFITFFRESLPFILSISGIVLLHEFGHYVALKQFGYKDSKVLYFPLFNDFLIQKTPSISQKKRLLVILMGPLPGIIIGVALLWYYFQSLNQWVLEFSFLLIGVNVFSLLPLDPLKGGRLIQTLFFPDRQNVDMYFVLISSLLWIVAGYYTGFYLMIAFGFVMAFKVRSIQKNVELHDALDEQEINYKTSYAHLTDREYWRIRQVFLDFNPKIKEIITEGVPDEENENLMSEQVRQILDVPMNEDAGWFTKVIVLIISVSAVFYPLYLIQEHKELFTTILQHANL